MSKLEDLSFSKLRTFLDEKIYEGKRNLNNEKMFVRQRTKELKVEYQMCKERYLWKKRDAKLFYKKYKKGTITPAEKEVFFALLRRADW